MNLRELLLEPGSRVPFRCELSTDRLDFPAVLAYTAAPVGEGTIVNTAGALTLCGTLSAAMHCMCDRCASEFDREVSIPLEVPLATELQDEENPDYFLLDGDELDLEELLETVFILNMDIQILCREDCKGLCARCGKNLNEGPCSCRKESDPRLAVLEQLLDDKA
jgi:uncharacterized protein